jgi:lipopolysaccharide biosynthesis glycosyltransferase
MPTRKKTTTRKKNTDPDKPATAVSNAPVLPAEIANSPLVFLHNAKKKATVPEELNLIPAVPPFSVKIDPKNIPTARFLVGIMTGMNMRDRRTACRETWITTKQENQIVKFFHGDTMSENPEDTILLNCRDDYKHLPEKTFQFFQWALKNVAFDYLLKCDDDSYIRLDRIEKLVAENPETIGTKNPAIRDAYSGSVYLISRNVLEKIVNNGGLPTSGPEDIAVSTKLKSLGFSLKFDPRLIHDTSRPMAEWSEQISLHWVKPVAMHRIHQRFDVKIKARAKAEHKHWKDELVFLEDGRFFRLKISSEGGTYKCGNNKLTLYWEKWIAERLELDCDVFRSSNITVTFFFGSLPNEVRTHAITTDTTIEKSNLNTRDTHNHALLYSVTPDNVVWLERSIRSVLNYSEKEPPPVFVMATSNSGKIEGHLRDAFCELSRKIKVVTIPELWNGITPRRQVVIQRLLAPFFFPEIDFGVILDTDIIAVSEISDLFQVNLKGKLMGAVADYWPGHKNAVADKLMDGRKVEPFFNGGVVVYDFLEFRKRINKEGLLASAQSCAEKLGERKPYDEAVLNTFLYEYIAQLPLRFNAYFWIFHEHHGKSFIPAEFKDAVERAVLIHYPVAWRTKFNSKEAAKYGFEEKFLRAVETDNRKFPLPSPSNFPISPDTNRTRLNTPASTAAEPKGKTVAVLSSSGTKESSFLIRPWTTGFPMKPRTDPVHVVYATTDDYSQAIVDGLAAIVENSRRPLRCTILTRGIICGDGSILRNVEVFCEKHGIAYRHVPVAANPVWREKGFFLKTMLPFFLPDDERCIFLDTDTVVFDDIGKLWDADLGDCIGALADERQHLLDIDGIPTNDEDPNFGEINSGVALWDIPKLRKTLKSVGTEQALANYFFTNTESRRRQCLAYFDQAIVNTHLRTKILKLPPHWGAMISYRWWRGSGVIRPKNVFEYSKRAPSILHYCGNEKKKHYHTGAFSPYYRSIDRRREMIDLGMSIVPVCLPEKSLFGVPSVTRDTVFCVRTHPHRRAQRHGIRQSWGKELGAWDHLLFYCGSHESKPCDIADMVIADIFDADVNNTRILIFLLQALEDSGVEYGSIFLCGDETWVRPSAISKLANEKGDIITGTGWESSPADTLGGVFLTRKAAQAFLKTKHAEGAWVLETLWWATKDVVSWKKHRGLGWYRPFSGSVEDKSIFAVRSLSPEQMCHASFQEKNTPVAKLESNRGKEELFADGGVHPLGTWDVRHNGGIAVATSLSGVVNLGTDGDDVLVEGNLPQKPKRRPLFCNHEKDPKWVVCFCALLETARLHLKNASDYYFAAGAEKILVYITQIHGEHHASDNEGQNPKTAEHAAALENQSTQRLWEFIHEWAYKEPRIEFIDAGGGFVDRHCLYQNRIYGSCVKKLRGMGYWMLVVDMDEYLTLQPGLTMGTLLREAESSPFRTSMVAFAEMSAYSFHAVDKAHPDFIHGGLQNKWWKAIVRVDDTRETDKYPNYNFSYTGRSVGLDIESGFLMHRREFSEIKNAQLAPWRISDFLVTPPNLYKRPVWCGKYENCISHARHLIDAVEFKKPFQIPSIPIPESKLQAFVFTSDSPQSKHRRNYFAYDWNSMNCPFEYVFEPYGDGFRKDEVEYYENLGMKKYARQRAAFVRFLQHVLEIMDKKNLQNFIYMEDNIIPMGNANWDFLEPLLLEKRPEDIDVVLLSRHADVVHEKESHPLYGRSSEFIKLSSVNYAAGMWFGTRKAAEFALKCCREVNMVAANWWVGEFLKQGGGVSKLPYSVAMRGEYPSM